MPLAGLTDHLLFFKALLGSYEKNLNDSKQSRQFAVGVWAIRPQSTIVLLSLNDDARLKAEAQPAGAAALVDKQEDIALLLTTIRQWPGHQ